MKMAKPVVQLIGWMFLVAELPVCSCRQGSCEGKGAVSANG
jgi:hypothetical protein